MNPNKVHLEKGDFTRIAATMRAFEAAAKDGQADVLHRVFTLFSIIISLSKFYHYENV
ncbi:MAG TPA: hypothetical protein VFV79_09635 [Saprospiraceae bacterium]|nr:hypothetical protein [Saprospiraceae bacterium]